MGESGLLTTVWESERDRRDGGVVEPHLREDPRFGGSLGEHLDSYLWKFDLAARWAVHPLYPNNAEGAVQKERDIALMLQDYLIGKVPRNRKPLRRI